jgi:hypothetical protein
MLSQMFEHGIVSGAGRSKQRPYGLGVMLSQMFEHGIVSGAGRGEQRPCGRRHRGWRPNPPALPRPVGRLPVRPPRPISFGAGRCLSPAT